MQFSVKNENVLKELCSHYTHYSQPAEMFGKEMVMTQDQASLKNRQLPKGYFYIPLNCLPKDKQESQDASSVEPDG